jgi:hypothetical protein
VNLYLITLSNSYESMPLEEEEKSGEKSSKVFLRSYIHPKFRFSYWKVKMYCNENVCTFRMRNLTIFFGLGGDGGRVTFDLHECPRILKLTLLKKI